MKKIFLLFAFAIATLTSFSQHGTFTDVRLVNGDSTISGTGDGTIFYNRVSKKFRFRQNGSWTSLPTFTISNTGSANEIVKSDGTNVVPTGLFSATLGDISMGTSTTSGTTRNITANGSGLAINLDIEAKGAGYIALGNTSTGNMTIGNTSTTSIQAFANLINLTSQGSNGITLTANGGGNIILSNLAGSGTRFVTANSLGVLSTTTATYPGTSTSGDILYASATNVFSNLAKGSANQILGMNNGATAPEYKTASRGLTAASGTLKLGDLSYSSDIVFEGSANFNIGDYDGGFTEIPNIHLFANIVMLGDTDGSTFLHAGIKVDNVSNYIKLIGGTYIDKLFIGNTSTVLAQGAIPFGGSNGAISQNTSLLVSLSGGPGITIGSTSSVSGSRLSIFGSGSAPVNYYQYSSDVVGNILNYYKARGTGTTAIVTGDNIASHTFNAYDGSTMKQVATISIATTGTIATNQVPTNMIFQVTGQSGTLYNALVLKSGGMVNFSSRNSSTGIANGDFWYNGTSFHQYFGSVDNTVVSTTTNFNNGSLLNVAFGDGTSGGYGGLQGNSDFTYDLISKTILSPNINSTSGHFIIQNGAGKNWFATVFLSGGQAITTVSGATTGSVCFVTLKSVSGVIATTLNYSCACTTDTVTITAVNSAGGINTLDNSALNFWIIN